MEILSPRRQFLRRQSSEKLKIVPMTSYRLIGLPNSPAASVDIQDPFSIQKNLSQIKSIKDKIELVDKVISKRQNIEPESPLLENQKERKRTKNLTVPVQRQLKKSPSQEDVLQHPHRKPKPKVSSELSKKKLIKLVSETNLDAEKIVSSAIRNKSIETMFYTDDYKKKLHLTVREPAGDIATPNRVIHSRHSSDSNMVDLIWKLKGPQSGKQSRLSLKRSHTKSQVHIYNHEVVQEIRENIANVALHNPFFNIFLPSHKPLMIPLISGGSEEVSPLTRQTSKRMNGPVSPSNFNILMRPKTNHSLVPEVQIRPIMRNTQQGKPNNEEPDRLHTRDSYESIHEKKMSKEYNKLFKQKSMRLKKEES